MMKPHKHKKARKMSIKEVEAELLRRNKSSLDQYGSFGDIPKVKNCKSPKPLNGKKEKVRLYFYK